MPFRRLRSLLLAAAACVSLASCSIGDSPFAAQRRPPNASDAAFLRSMTEHERATLGITRLGRHRALRAELRGIARTMTTEQQQDLRELGSLARDPGSRAVPPSATSSSAMSDLARVKDATSFDYEFMRTLIEQNQSAIAIARHEARYGSDPDVKRLAAAIESARTKERERLRMWLRVWYGGDIQPGPPSLGPPGGGNGGPKPGPSPSAPGKRSPVPL